MGRRALWILSLSTLIATGACKDEAPAAAAASEPAPAEPQAPTPAEPEEVVELDGLPSEPGTRLIEPGKGTPVALPARAPGTPNRLVIELSIREGKKKVLHVPAVRLAGDVILDAADQQGFRYRMTPRAAEVLTRDGVEPEFLASFASALRPAEPPVTVNVGADRWNSVTAADWPSASTTPTSTVAAGMRLALSHLSIPTPAEGLAKGSAWETDRQIDLFGMPTWQSLSCTAKKIEGAQLEVECEAVYRLVPDAEVSTPVLGLETVTTLEGSGRLRARFDIPTAVPIDMQLLGKLAIGSGDVANPKRINFEVRADEDYLAKPDARVTLLGPLTQGGLVRGKVAPGTKVWFNKKKTRVSPEGDFIFGFGRDAAPRALLAFSFGGGPIERHIVHVADREFEPEEIDGLPEKMVNLDRETRRALNKSNKAIEKIRNKASDTPYFRDGFRMPARGKITSTYGRKRILNGEDHGYHWGLDLAARPGTKVKAPAPGVVVFAEKNVPLSGNLIILDHGHGFTTSYLHLQKIKVKVGDTVRAGQQIGTIGNTGRSTGPHLDWRGNLFGTRIDVQTLLDDAG